MDLFRLTTKTETRYVYASSWVDALRTIEKWDSDLLDNLCAIEIEPGFTDKIMIQMD